MTSNRIPTTQASASAAATAFPERVTRRAVLAHATAISVVATVPMLIPTVVQANPLVWLWRILVRLFGRNAARRAAVRTIVRAQAVRRAGAAAAFLEAADGFLLIHDLVSLADMSDTLVGVRPRVHASIREHGSQAIWFAREYNRYQLSYFNDSGRRVAGQLMFEIEDLENQTQEVAAGPWIALQAGAEGIVPVSDAAQGFMAFPRLAGTGPKLIRPFLRGEDYVLFSEIGPIQLVDRQDVQLAPGAGA
jgi:hypothetical protein